MSLPKCQYCDSTAGLLIYYSKLYPSGKDTIESPLFICLNCIDKAKQDLNVCRGGIEGHKIITFKHLGGMQGKAVGKLCSRRGYEINHLATKTYRELIFSIHFQSKPSKMDILRDSLKWYQGRLELKIKDEPDKILSSKIDCVNFLLADLTE